MPVTNPSGRAASGGDLVFEQRIGLSARVLATLAAALGVSVLVSWWQDAWVTAAIVAAVVAIAGFTRASVRIDASGFTVRVGRSPLVNEPLGRLVDAGVTQVRPLADFGGWGWRIARDGRRGFIAGSGKALLVTRLDGPAIVVTMPSAERAADILNALLAQRSPSG